MWEKIKSKGHIYIGNMKGLHNLNTSAKIEIHTRCVHTNQASPFLGFWQKESGCLSILIHVTLTFWKYSILSPISALLLNKLSLLLFISVWAFNSLNKNERIWKQSPKKTTNIYVFTIALLAVMGRFGIIVWTLCFHILVNIFTFITLAFLCAH